MADISKVGEIGGVDVLAVTLTGNTGNGLRVKLLNHGARLAELWVADRAGTLADIVLGHDDLAAWETTGKYLGATCGRYANRIAGGRFELDGQTIQVDRNEGANHLHGGIAGFDTKVWEIEDHGADHVTFKMTSPDGEMGYPGTLTARTTYRIDSDGCLVIEMTATTTAPTIVNIVNHAYFNLAGHASGDIMDQHLRIDAAFYTPVDSELIPTGEVLAVAGTPFDFRSPRAIGESLPSEAAFDHNFCLSMPTDASGLRSCAVAVDPASGRRLTLSTTEPGVQFYTGAHFDGAPAKGGARYGRFAGFAIETQRFPNSPNLPHFPAAHLQPGETYRHLMRFDFTPDA